MATVLPLVNVTVVVTMFAVVKWSSSARALCVVFTQTLVAFERCCNGTRARCWPQQIDK